MTSFQKELQGAQAPLRAYVGMLCGSSQDVSDLMGAVNLALLSRQATYDPARPFLPWARTLARYEVLSWRTRRRRSRIVLSDTALDLVADEVDDRALEEEARWQRRLDLLAAAERELTPEMRYLVSRRYVYGETPAAIGRQLHRSANAIAQSLHYICGVLKRSIEKKMRTEEEANDRQS